MTLAATKKLARQLMDKHGLLPYWSFEFDRAVTRHGCCHYSKRLITLSKSYVLNNDEALVTDTILHEIAHALAPRLEGHGSRWRTIALSIGCNGQRTTNAKHNPTRPKYTGSCRNCSRVITAHRRNKIACGRCCRIHNGGRFTNQYLIVWAA